VISISGLIPENLPVRVVLTDDPLRAKMLAAHHLEYSALVYGSGDVLAYSGSYKNVAIAVISSGFGSGEVLSCCNELKQRGATEIIYLGACLSTDRRHGLRSVVLASGGSSGLIDRANIAAELFDLKATARMLTPGALEPGEGCIIDDVTGAFYELARENGFEALSILTVSEDMARGERMEEHEVRSRFYDAARLAFETYALEFLH